MNEEKYLSMYHDCSIESDATIQLQLNGSLTPELLKAEEGHYVFNQDTLEEEVFEYMQTTNLAPMIQIKNNQIIGFTVSQVMQPKPLPPPPVKPKRTEFDKGKKGQPHTTLRFRHMRN